MGEEEEEEDNGDQGAATLDSGGRVDTSMDDGGADVC